MVAGGGFGRQNHVQVKRYESMVFDLISGCFIDVHMFRFGEMKLKLRGAFD